MKLEIIVDAVVAAAFAAVGFVGGDYVYASYVPQNAAAQQQSAELARYALATAGACTLASAYCLYKMMLPHIRNSKGGSKQ